MSKDNDLEPYTTFSKRKLPDPMDNDYQWCTDDGRDLYVWDMKTDHLDNCVKWIKENAGRDGEPWIALMEYEIHRRFVGGKYE